MKLIFIFRAYAKLLNLTFLTKFLTKLEILSRSTFPVIYRPVRQFLRWEKYYAHK